MNSVIQILLNLPEIQQIFLEKNPNLFVISKSEKKSKGKKEETVYGSAVKKGELNTKNLY